MITVKITGLKEAMARANPKQVRQAAKLALGRTRDSVAAEAGRLITGKYNISRKDLLNKASGAPRIQVSGRVGDDLTATISFRAGGISLAYFGAVEYRKSSAGLVKIGRKLSKAVRRGEIGVTVQIEKGKTTRLRQFFAAVKYGKGEKAGTHAGVFRRAGRGRLPIIESKTISPASMIRKPELLEPLTRFAQGEFRKRFSHELKRLGVA